MPIINKGTSFSNGEQLTADKINNLLDLATFNQSATDSASTTVNSASQIVVADSGVTTAKLATDAVETAKIADANVTFAKLTDVIDDDTMATATATTLATSESIKAYVDEYAMKYSGVTGTGLQTSGFSTYRDLDLSSTVGANRTLVIMEVHTGTAASNLLFRAKGSAVKPYGGANLSGYGSSGGIANSSGDGFTCIINTNENGVLEYTGNATSTGIEYTIQAFQKLA